MDEDGEEEHQGEGGNNKKGWQQSKGKTLNCPFQTTLKSATRTGRPKNSETEKTGVGNIRGGKPPNQRGSNPKAKRKLSLSNHIKIGNPKGPTEKM